jgi:hypothetical protein
MAIYYVSLPFLYVFVRLLEPAVYSAFKRSIRRIFRLARSNEDQGSDEADELNGFLTSSLNTELVYVIL